MDGRLFASVHPISREWDGFGIGGGLTIENGTRSNKVDNPRKRQPRVGEAKSAARGPKTVVAYIIDGRNQRMSVLPCCCCLEKELSAFLPGSGVGGGVENGGVGRIVRPVHGASRGTAEGPVRWRVFEIPVARAVRERNVGNTG